MSPPWLLAPPTARSEAVRLELAMEPLSAVVDTGLAGSFFSALYFSVQLQRIIALQITNSTRPKARLVLSNLYPDKAKGV